MNEQVNRTVSQNSILIRRNAMHLWENVDFFYLLTLALFMSRKNTAQQQAFKISNKVKPRQKAEIV